MGVSKNQGQNGRAPLRGPPKWGTNYKGPLSGLLGKKSCIPQRPRHTRRTRRLPRFGKGQSSCLYCRSLLIISNIMSQILNMAIVSRTSNMSQDDMLQNLSGLQVYVYICICMHMFIVSIYGCQDLRHWTQVGKARVFGALRELALGSSGMAYQDMAVDPNHSSQDSGNLQRDP